jgi:hypothetical protein
MVHVGYEASAVLGGNKKLGDTWKMLSWTISGKMGGLLGKPNGNGHSNGNGHGNGNGNGHASGQGNAKSRAVPLAPAAQQQDEVFRIL